MLRDGERVVKLMGNDSEKEPMNGFMYYNNRFDGRGKL